jgi:hypothetical protein
LLVGSIDTNKKSLSTFAPTRQEANFADRCSTSPPNRQRQGFGTQTIHQPITHTVFSNRFQMGNDSRDITALFATVRTECGSRNLNPTVAKQRVRGVFSCAGGEIEPSYPLYLQGLRHSWRQWRLSPHVARDTSYSHAWPAGDPFAPQTLDRLAVSRRPGYQGVGFALSVPTPQGWLRSREGNAKNSRGNHPSFITVDQKG